MRRLCRRSQSANISAVSLRRDLAPRLDSLLDRGIGAAWVSAFPIVGLQAAFVRGHHPLLDLIERKLSVREAVARLGWREHTAADVPEYLNWWVDDLAILGFIAGRNGAAAVDALLETLGQREHFPETGADLVGAVLAAPDLLPRYEARLPRHTAGEVEVLTQMAEVSALGGPVHAATWIEMFGSAVREPDVDAALDHTLALIMRNARDYAGFFAHALHEIPTTTADHAAKLAALLTDLTPDQRQKSTVRHALVRYCLTLAEAGQSELACAALARVRAVWGEPRGWAMDAFKVLCAAGEPEEALQLRPQPRQVERILLLTSFWRIGDHPSACRELEHLLDHADLITTPSMSTVLVLASDNIASEISPRELLRLATITRDLPDNAQRRTRLVGAVAALPDAVR